MSTSDLPPVHIGEKPGLTNIREKRRDLEISDLIKSLMLSNRLKLSSTLECAKSSPGDLEDLERIEALNERADNFQMYETDRFSNLHPECSVTFRPSPQPFELPDDIRENLEKYGKAISLYYLTCKVLISSLPDDHRWIKYLEHSKPKWMLEAETREERGHVFLRPDFILTDGDPVITEIESSPFGLALSHFLSKAYRAEGDNVIGDEDEIIKEIKKELVREDDDKDGIYTYVYTDHTSRYKGQLEYLAQQLKDSGLNVCVVKPEEITEDEEGNLRCDGKKINAIYRSFYLHESVKNHKLTRILQNKSIKIVPPVAPRLEEKALMGMLFEPEFAEVFRYELGDENYEILEKIFPKTWIIDKETKPVNFPFPIEKWEDISELSRRNRSFVLKTSGFSDDSSWAKGITFLNKLSRKKCEELIKRVLNADNIYVLQEFRKGAKFEQPYFDFSAEMMKTMNGKVRLTPYYSVRDGKLLTAKATLCENTDFVHATIDSINVPVE